MLVYSFFKWRSEKVCEHREYRGYAEWFSFSTYSVSKKWCEFLFSGWFVSRAQRVSYGELVYRLWSLETDDSISCWLLSPSSWSKVPAVLSTRYGVSVPTMAVGLAPPAFLIQRMVLWESMPGLLADCDTCQIHYLCANMIWCLTNDLV